ncbi:hypothetical protein INT45_012609 [Circinella minor]|uniref:Uncharacterized protein n=1 Tax=Circinella minor TaxID=1195481 RepID=A0A8H7VBW1_9FUNG|nr:hypothetical protein INT45_012609 [Circinella minor]
MNSEHSINEMNATTTSPPAATPDTCPTKRARGRPKKNLSELDTTLKVLSRKVRPNTALAHRQPLAHWKSFCDENIHIL